MSSGSKGATVKNAPAKALTAEQVLQQRGERNVKAKANLMIREQEKMAADLKKQSEEFDEPGTALRLLNKSAEKAYLEAAKKEPMECGEAEDLDAEPSEVPDEAEEDEEDGGEPQDVEGEPNDDEEAADADQAADEQAADAEDGQQKGKRKGGKGGKGKWHKQKPWWASQGWGKQQGRGRKGQGKGKYDDYGGEYCHGGYRAANGEFFPHLGFTSVLLDVAGVACD